MANKKVFNPLTPPFDEVRDDIADLTTKNHHSLDGLTDDDHSIYPLLLGRAGGQTLIGDTASGGNLTLQSTAHATKGKILFGTSAYDEVNNRLGIGTTGPKHTLEVNGNIVANNLQDISSAAKPMFNGISLAEGNVGVARLVNGIATVINSKITEGSRIFLTPQAEMPNSKKAQQINSWAYRRGRGSGRLSIMRAEVRNEKNTPAIWTNWWFGMQDLYTYLTSGNLRVTLQETGKFKITSTNLADSGKIGYVLIN